MHAGGCLLSCAPVSASITTHYVKWRPGLSRRSLVGTGRPRPGPTRSVAPAPRACLVEAFAVCDVCAVARRRMGRPDGCAALIRCSGGVVAVLSLSRFGLSCLA